MWDLVAHKHDATANSITKGIEFHTLTTNATELQFRVSVALDPHLDPPTQETQFTSAQEIFGDLRRSESRLQNLIHPTQQPTLTELISTRKQIELQVAYFYTQIRHKNTGLAREMIYNELEPALQHYITTSANAERDAHVYSEYLLKKTVVNTHMVIIAFVVFVLFAIIILASKLRIILGDFTSRRSDGRRAQVTVLRTKEVNDGS